MIEVNSERKFENLTCWDQDTRTTNIDILDFDQPKSIKTYWYGLEDSEKIIEDL